MKLKDILFPPSRELFSSDRKYLAADQGDGNFVVYKRDTMEPVWDRWSYENLLDETPKPIPEIKKEPIHSNEPIRLTNEDHQLVRPVGYSYWNNINQHRGQSILRVVLCVNDFELSIFTVHKHELVTLGEEKLAIKHTGEGCYWSKSNPDWLYIPQPKTLYRYNVTNKHYDKVLEVNSDEYIWQCHSSYDGTVHSGMIKNSDWQPQEWFVHGGRYTRRIPFKGAPDECQIDKSGRFLVIKEGDDNRIINLETDKETMLFDPTGAAGHSDLGFGVMIGEDDHYPLPGALLSWDLKDPEDKLLLYKRTDWNMGHVSFCNAEDKPLAEQKALISGGCGTDLIVVKLDGSLKSRVVCPDLSEIRDYDNLPKANLCPTGEFACWTAWKGGRRDAFIVRVPDL